MKTFKMYCESKDWTEVKPRSIPNRRNDQAFEQVKAEIARQIEGKTRLEQIEDLCDLYDRARDAGDVDVKNICHRMMADRGYGIFTR